MPPEYTEHARWFAEQIQPHETMLRAWLRNRFARADDVDDIVQETYLRALQMRNLGRLFAPKAFLFTTARNLAIDRTRRLRHSEGDSLANPEVSNVSDGDDAIPEKVARRQEIAFLNRAIASLPDKCREIFVMRRIKDLSQKEIAQELGVSPNTVSAQLTIGMRKCAEYFEAHAKEVQS